MRIRPWAAAGRRPLRLLAAALSVLVWAGFGCVVGGDPAGEDAAVSGLPDRELVRETVEHAVAALNSGDVEAILELHTDDAVVLKPGHAPEIGKEVMRKSLEDLFERLVVDESRTIEEVEVAGDWAFVRGNYQVTLTPRNNGEPVTENGKYIDILRRVSDGEWKFSRSIWNSNGPR